jgi:hypothetical protein
MKWQHIRQQHPHQWLLIEAISAHSEAHRRVLDDIAVVDAFLDSITAFQRYQTLHREAPQRELYVLHTDRKELDITERTWLGVRAAP